MLPNYMSKFFGSVVFRSSRASFIQFASRTSVKKPFARPVAHAPSASKPLNDAAYFPRKGTNTEDVKSLVCSYCWQNIFNTPEYEIVCRGRPENEQTQNSESIEYTRSTSEILEASAAGCTWCSLQSRFISNKAQSHHFPCQIGFSSSRLKMATPAGRNVFYLSVDILGKHEGGVLLMNAFTTEQDNASAYITPRPLQLDVSPEATKNSIRNWMQECEHHDCCPPQLDTSLPHRVIEVIDKPRIIHGDGRKGRYATLSYCGGSHSSVNLTASTLDQFMQQIPTEALPQTFQDAISVAKTIPVDYLWIDSLCVLQDSTEDRSVADTQRESIFRQSQVHIVASNTDDISKGFLQARSYPVGTEYCALSNDLAFTVPFRIGEQHFGTMSLQCLNDRTVHEEHKEAINKRAWTFQEQLATPRSLVYASHTLQWRCKAGTKNLGNSLHQEYGDEEEHSSTIATLSKIPEDQEGIFFHWLKLVMVYSDRKVSVPEHKLRALSSIAKHYKESLGPSYYAGIWETNILWQLCWQRSDPDYSSSSSTRYPAPSWSWASVDSGVYFQFDRDNENVSFACKLLSITAPPKHPTLPHAEAESGQITLQGKMRKAFLVETHDHPPLAVAWHSDAVNSQSAAEAAYKEYKEKMEKSDWDLEEDYWPDARYDIPGDQPKLVELILLAEGFGLLLREVEKSASGQRQYKRIGSANSSFTLKMNDFEGLVDTEVAII